MSDPLPMIPLAEPTIGGNARRYLEECLATNFVSSVGPFVERFEREFAHYVGARHAVACASGTAAIHVALRLLGVQSGDEIFAPTLTFIASANPILYEHAVPVLFDSELETWNLDPALVIEEIERRARTGQKQPVAVEVVHLLGHPASIDALVPVCERHGIAILEDAAEALGARYTAGSFAGRHVGTVGTIGCFSFNGNKIITTGGGGMIVTDDPALAKRAKHLTTQARLPGAAYWHDEVGYNYRLTNLAAALGVAQLEQLPHFLERKRSMAKAYDEGLGGVAGVTLPPSSSWASRTAWLYSARFDTAKYGASRDEVMHRLGGLGIQARPIWSPLHLMPMYASAPRFGGERAEQLARDTLSLPSSVSLEEGDIQRVVRAVAS